MLVDITNVGVIWARRLRPIEESPCPSATLAPSCQSDEEITIFDSTGIALQDVAAAAFLYDKAQQQGFGSILTTWEMGILSWLSVCVSRE